MSLLNCVRAPVLGHNRETVISSTSANLTLALLGTRDQTWDLGDREDAWGTGRDVRFGWQGK